MRTTIDIPDNLFREAKAKAALEGIKFKDLMERFVRDGLRGHNGAERHRSRRNDIPIPEKWRNGGPRVPSMTGAEIQELFDEEDYGDLVGKQRG